METRVHMVAEPSTRSRPIPIWGGGKKNKSWILNLLASCPHSPWCADSKNIRMSSELHWEVLPLDSHFGAIDEPKIQRK